MILDAILLALAEIASNHQREVAILPEMRIASGDGVQISHPVSGYELWLSGNVDYAVIEYEDVKDNKGESNHQTPFIARGMNLPLSQTGCSPLVDPETTRSRLQKVACS
jgi:hypothetical protein